MNIKQFLKKENNNLDIIRLVSASLVIVGHSYRINPYPGKQDIVEYLTGFTYSAALAVKIFFFISGMLVTGSLLKKQSASSFVISRAFRIMPALLFLLILTAFVIGPLISDFPPSLYFKSYSTYSYVIYNLIFYSNYRLPGVFQTNDLPLDVNGSLWTLRYEVGCYAMLLILFVSSVFTRQSFRLICHIIIALVLVDAIFDIRIFGADNQHSLVVMPFAVGALLALNSERIVIGYKTVLLFMSATALCWRFNHINEVLFDTTVCLAVVPLSQSKWLRKISIKNDISYGVYLWGFLVQQTVFHLMGRQNIYLFMIYCLGISCVMGYISFILVEKRFIGMGRSLVKRQIYPGKLKKSNPEEIAKTIVD